MKAHDEPFYPDGLTAEYIETLLVEAELIWSSSACPTSAMSDGSAEERRRRRTSRRMLGAVVCALPTTARSAASPDSEVA